MRIFSIASVILINTIILARYTWLLRTRRIKPALAMWVFFSIAVAGSLVTYLSEGDYSPADNILNTADLLLCVSVSVVIFLWGDRSTRFNRFDRGCLAAVLVILVFWALTRRHVASHLMIQSILVIAYFPVVKRLWGSNENTESFVAWICLLLAPIASLLSSRGALATVYAVRAIVSTAILLSLMTRAELRGRRLRALAQKSPARV